MWRSLSLLLACLLLGGCGLLPSSIVPAIHHNEVPTPPGPRQRGHGYASAELALRRFAGTYINWNAGDVQGHLRALARASVGQARSAMVLQASQSRGDRELSQAQLSNSGSVQAVAALAGGHGRYVVVTRESTHASASAGYQGLAPAWHLALATVSRQSGRWVVSSWQPEN
ncbi:MAG: hypothetical protein J2O48_11395 [Solirubrobacterales bacterium]|nr:hypothetical protein [Solirubrobacterales bacterium]